MTGQGNDADLDLYCLNCGYNLRGLSGDPMSVMTVPAGAVARELRRMETAPTVCVAATLAALLFAGMITLVLLKGRYRRARLLRNTFGRIDRGVDLGCCCLQALLWRQSRMAAGVAELSSLWSGGRGSDDDRAGLRGSDDAKVDRAWQGRRAFHCVPEYRGDAVGGGFRSGQEGTSADQGHDLSASAADRDTGGSPDPGEPGAAGGIGE